ncbi:MAG UNVERIFIED_CONTAM: UDP-phosphate alpha-N-acetylglucosaminyltransferase [Rickettsiaceae bacterium]|jgi:Fuc2NAc and GlcNAc transferase
MEYIILFLSFFFCLILTRLFVILLPKIGIVDNPDNRRLHKKITPTGGGLAFVITFVPAFYCLDKLLLNGLWALPIITSIASLAIISFYDDFKEVSPFSRLITHIIIAAYLVYQIFLPNALFHGELPYWIDFTLAFLALAGFTNIYNFMDGIDGITASESIHLSLTLLIICYIRSDIIMHADLIMTIASLILICSIAFIVYNWHPAYIFIGDVGTITIGILLGLCMMLVAASSSEAICFCNHSKPLLLSGWWPYYYY